MEHRINIEMYSVADTVWVGWGILCAAAAICSNVCVNQYVQTNDVATGIDTTINASRHSLSAIY